MKKIRVFSSPFCPYCMAAKDFLKENDLIFEDLDISRDSDLAKELIAKTGQIGVPVIEIDGSFVIGFDREKLKEKLCN